MSRRRSENSISFFSFQDVMMSVCGIVILVTLLLVLKLIVQGATPEEPVETISQEQLKEIEEQIESLTRERREIQDEITQLQHERAAAANAPWVPSDEKLNALSDAVERAQSEIDDAKGKLATETKRTEELESRQDAVSVNEKEKLVQELTQLAESLKTSNKELAEVVAKLRNSVKELAAENSSLDRALATPESKKVFFSSRKATDKTPWIVVYDASGISVLTFSEPQPKKFASESEFFQWSRNRNARTEYFVVYLRPSRVKQYEDFLGRIRSQGFDLGLDLMGEKTEFSVSP